MDLSLYAKVKDSARYCRSLDVRRKINLFLRAIKSQDIKRSCEIFGVSRSYYYRWWKRFMESGFDWESLEVRSRRPHYSPRQTSRKVVQKIKYYRKHYRYGPRRILYYLEQNHQIEVSRVTVARIIKREGLILKKYRTKKVNPHKKRYSLDWPGQMIQLDIKYVPYRIQGKRFYAFNAIDDCSRWRFARIYDNKGLESCIDFVEDLIKYTPFRIQVIQTDNEKVFTNRYSFTANDPENHYFTEILKQHHIRHRLIPPGAKELNGKVERSHRIDDDEFFWKAPRHSQTLLKQAYAQWIWEYNHDRPHSSLNSMTPIEKLLERTLVTLFTDALLLDLDPVKIFSPKPIIKKLTKLDTYFKYLQSVESDYIPVSDVMSFYNRLIFSLTIIFDHSKL